MRKRPAVAVSHDKTAWCFFDVPRQREAVTVEHADDRSLIEIVFVHNKPSPWLVTVITDTIKRSVQLVEALVPQPRYYSGHPEGLHRIEIPFRGLDANVP